MSNDHVLRTARPTTAAIAWATSDAIYYEIPAKDGGAPYIVRERRSIEGLARALNVLIEHAAPPLLRDPNADHAAVQRVEPKPTKVTATWATDAQREKTRELLRKMGKI